MLMMGYVKRNAQGIFLWCPRNSLFEQALEFIHSHAKMRVYDLGQTTIMILRFLAY